MNNVFTPLDATIPTLLGQPFGFTIGQTTGFLAITSFVLFFILAADGVAAFGRILYALGLRVANSDNEAKLTVANKIISSALFSLFFSYSLVLLFVTVVNPDMVTGNADFSGIVVTSMKVGSQTPVSSTGSSSCPDENSFKSTVISNSNVCPQTTCTALVGCDTTTYSSLINNEASKQGVDPKVVTILMCRESKGIKDAKHVNDPPNSIDCGLMQINKPGSTSCDAIDFDPQTNIAKGVSLIKAKYSSISQSYQNISKDMLVFASYNCCSDGSPNAQSSDCTPTSGYPYTLPKWACPINPGQTSTNMCFVRNYVCDVSACLSQLKL